jgi:hypothetical protein
MALQFPTTNSAEVKNWLQIQAFEHDPNLSQQEGSQAFGAEKTPKMRLTAPQSIVENNTQVYSSSDFKLSSAIANIGSTWNSADWLETTAGVGLGAAKLALSALPGVGEEAARYFGTTVNPRSEQLYSAPGFRTWTFHWELAPLSGGDDKALKEIIRLIRKSSYPTLQNKMLYKMPHEFKIKLVGMAGGKLTQNTLKFGKCVCTNVGINYTGSGVNVVSDASNSPFINLDITMVERILLHQGSKPIK